MERAGAVGSASDFGPKGPAHWTLGRRVPGSIPVRGVVCCGLEQVTFPQLNVYSVHMFLNSRNKSSTELMLVVEI